MTPAQTAINNILRQRELPLVQNLVCNRTTCYGTVQGNKTTWYLDNGVRLVCVCYLRNVPKPIERKN